LVLNYLSIVYQKKTTWVLKKRRQNNQVKQSKMFGKSVCVGKGLKKAGKYQHCQGKKRKSVRLVFRMSEPR